jgi:hypothetical protein
MSNVQPGIYDNTRTMRRERYQDCDGEVTLVQWLTASLIETKEEYGGPPNGKVSRWGAYPDLSEGAGVV